jgi:hypothetical protein
MSQALTPDELREHLQNCIGYGRPSDYHTDNYGQVIIYTGIYQWEDGTFHLAPETDEPSPLIT